MGRTPCTELQCLYKGALYLNSVPVQGCPLPLPLYYPGWRLQALWKAAKQLDHEKLRLVPTECQKSQSVCVTRTCRCREVVLSWSEHGYFREEASRSFLIINLQLLISGSVANAINSYADETTSCRLASDLTTNYNLLSLSLSLHHRPSPDLSIYPAPSSDQLWLSSRTPSPPAPTYAVLDTGVTRPESRTCRDDILQFYRFET